MYISFVIVLLSSQGSLIHWSKNYQVRGLRDKDVVQTLREAIDRNGVQHLASLIIRRIFIRN